MRSAAEIATIVRKLYAQEHRIATCLNMTDSVQERRQLEQDRQRVAHQRHALGWVLGDEKIIWLLEDR